MQRSIAAAGTAAAFAVLLLAGAQARAADVVTKVQNYGTLTLPFSTSYGNTFTAQAPLATGDTFYDDYAFTIADGSFSSITATFNLASILQINSLQARLFAGDPWPGATPGTLSAADLLQRWSATVASGSGSGSVQVIDPINLGAGHYVLEVRGKVAGAAGGSYAGVFNVSPVPEPSAVLLALIGVGTLTFVRRRL
jgi:hypothetical protein